METACWYVNDKLEVIWKEVVVAETRCYPETCLGGGGLNKSTKYFNRIASVLTEIRTEHLPNTSLERCHYADWFCFGLRSLTMSVRCSGTVYRSLSPYYCCCNKVVGFCVF
jgi:hypothetical protein